MEKHKKINFTNNVKEKVDTFFQKRYFKNKSIDIKVEDSMNINAFKRKYNLINEKSPIWGVFTHITWDGVFGFNPMIFSSIDEWLNVTIENIKNFDKIVWLIKIHPAEVI